MKKIIILAVLVMTTIFNCTERDLMIMREADREMNERDGNAYIIKGVDLKVAVL